MYERRKLVGVLIGVCVILLIILLIIWQDWRTFFYPHQQADFQTETHSASKPQAVYNLIQWPDGRWFEVVGDIDGRATLVCWDDKGEPHEVYFSCIKRHSGDKWRLLKKIKKYEFILEGPFLTNNPLSAEKQTGQ